MIRRRMRALFASVAVHVALLALVALHGSRRDVPERATAVASVAIAEPVAVDVVIGSGGDVRDSHHEVGSRSPAPAPAHRSAPRAAADAWEQVTISMDSRSPTNTGTSNGKSREIANSDGGGTGNGFGRGIGDGVGVAAVRIPDDVPAAAAPEPEPARVSMARPAKLVYPTRDHEVEDEADLFVAKVTVDADGDVVGARMVKTRPGARGDQAANAIWSFRYLPALDDDGRPIRSTFEQPFQIRR